ncbi:amidase [Enterovirga rhinocerotis]|uniref:Indoleacetamide hydrolase n=1 Tax=Enterovirga rhinocerotis TaxID=1339210 RepID=A0A4R7BTM5_9HYPH|nr:amidase [Enterovirga rhinocerotis]TDR89094.1 amidase [Enterovirga rhinocerotis]
MAGRSVAGTDIADWDAIDVTKAIADKTVSCAEVMTAYLDRIERLNPVVNAIVSLRDREAIMADARRADEEIAAGRRRGPLHGLPQAIKDLAPCKGFPNTLGSPIHANTMAETDGIMVERMRAAGAIFIGKTNVPEFGLGSNTYNPVFGPTLNAYDQSRTAGGSSGGAAVALALGMLPVADGSDHGGSLRNPAAYNNVFGLRPSYGRVPGGTDEIFSTALGVSGPMARTVPDLALLLSVQAGYDPRIPTTIREDGSAFAKALDTDVSGWRVGWLGDLGGQIALEPGIRELCEAGLKALEGIGVKVEHAPLPDFPLEEMFQNWIRLRSAGFAAARRADYADPAKRALLKPEAQWEAEQGATVSALDFEASLRVRTAWYEAVRRLFDRYDILVLPTAQVFPFPKDVTWPRRIGEREMDTYHRWMQVVIPFTMANLPAISVPVGFNEAGLPMGMQLAGRSGDELSVLRIAHAYDQATQWVKRRRPGLLSGA